MRPSARGGHTNTPRPSSGGGRPQKSPRYDLLGTVQEVEDFGADGGILVVDGDRFGITKAEYHKDRGCACVECLDWPEVGERVQLEYRMSGDKAWITALQRYPGTPEEDPASDSTRQPGAPAAPTPSQGAPVPAANPEDRLRGLRLGVLRAAASWYDGEDPAGVIRTANGWLPWVMTSKFDGAPSSASNEAPKQEQRPEPPLGDRLQAPEPEPAPRVSQISSHRGRVAKVSEYGFLVDRVWHNWPNDYDGYRPQAEDNVEWDEEPDERGRPLITAIRAGVRMP